LIGTRFVIATRTLLTFLENEKKQRRKHLTFTKEAITSPDKHHLRWCNELLSAASNGKAPLAKVVARILRSRHLPDNPNKMNQDEC
jgi:hypothetical protein